ncbi:MAG: hypothetical protein AB7U46_17360 [Paenirhodobacter sp.]|uniref:hypothetical protein n=1 Tax=Paenirhodobacter sp. TaxID=1965326 RepID=UPI003D0A4081
MTQILFEGELFADYHQIYLRDEACPDLPDAYTEEDLGNRLMVSPTAAVIFTARAMEVPLRVEWSDVRPAVEVGSYQHVVEAGLQCTSGQLVLAGLTDFDGTAPRLQVRSGSLGLRVSFAGLDALSEDELDGDDRYLLQLWPETELRRMSVLKVRPTV